MIKSITKTNKKIIMSDTLSLKIVLSKKIPSSPIDLI